MASSATQYRQQLQALLPDGLAWPRGEQAQLTKLIDAFAAEFARADRRADDLRNEADPRTAWEMLADWERITGLPGKCMAGVAQTIDERRDALVGKLGELGGQSRDYFIALAARLGFTITITEFRPFVAGSHAGDPAANGDWISVWQVNAALNMVRTFKAGSAAGEALASWSNTLLECAIKDDAPAHTIVQFAYT